LLIVTELGLRSKRGPTRGCVAILAGKIQGPVRIADRLRRRRKHDAEAKQKKVKRGVRPYAGPTANCHTPPFAAGAREQYQTARKPSALPAWEEIAYADLITEVSQTPYWSASTVLD
jgi:hypothetical protein